ncbi:MAG TPA: site-specific integrase [Phycicoccus sp.]|nr:site-specific integrase [Phycicoccus sp.]
MTGRRGRRGFGQIRKLPSGRWQASYMAPDLRRLNAPVTFFTKTDAEGWLGLEHRKIADGAWERPKPPEPPAPPPVLETFGDYATTWVATRDIKPKTREGYEHILSKYLLPAFGARPLAEITPPAVRAWWSSMDPRTPTVRSRAYGVLKAVMNTAVADDLVDANPCRIRGASNAPRARDVRPATVEELAVIVEAMPDRYRALVLLGAWCALRSGEMLELRRRDVDLVNGTVRVERAVSQVHGRAVIGTPKSAAGIRTVTIPPHVVPAIAHHLEEFTLPGPDALLFPAADGVSSLQPSGFYKYWKEARAAAGRPDLRIHDLRHTGATMAAMAGATLAELQQRLGHSSVNAALRYQHAAQGRDRQIAEALSRMTRPDTE